MPECCAVCGSKDVVAKESILDNERHTVILYVCKDHVDKRILGKKKGWIQAQKMGLKE